MIRILLTATLLASSAPLTVTAQSPGSSTSDTETASPPAPSCAAQTTVDACLDTTAGQAGQCSPTDYGCLCSANTVILTYVLCTLALFGAINILTHQLTPHPANRCFASCPDDARKAGYQSSKDSYWCVGAAPAFPLFRYCLTVVPGCLSPTRWARG